MPPFKLRLTQSALRKPYAESWEIITSYLADQYPSSLIVVEHHPKVHLHMVGVVDNLDHLTSFSRERFTSRGFMCQYYKEEELQQRPIEYYYGYLLKQDDKEIISSGNIDIEACSLVYQTSKEDPASSFKQFIIRNNPQDFEHVHRLCILWYRHSTSDFKYDNIKKKYCRALMYAFPDQFTRILENRFNHEKLIS